MGVAGYGASAFQYLLNDLHARRTGAGNGASAGISAGIPVVSDYGDNPWPIFFDASGPANTSISRTSMAYCVREYRAWPRRWVVEAMIPFIHPSLYAGLGSTSAARMGLAGGGEAVASALGLSSTSLTGLPPPLQDAFAVSAAYAAKNDANADLVMQLVEAKTAALLYSPDQGNWTIMEQLAALQALLVYQISRLFDGDIRQRALAETVEPVQAAWTAALQARVGADIFQGAELRPVPPLTTSDIVFNSLASSSTGPAAFTMSDDLASGWQRWLFSESVRRTIITSFMVRGIYAMAKQGYCRLGPVVTDMSFTSNSRLWVAKTPERWRRAVSETDPGWINRMNFSEMLSRADANDVDEFGVMMAVTYRGKEAVEDWMARDL